MRPLSFFQIRFRLFLPFLHCSTNPWLSISAPMEMAILDRHFSYYLWIEKRSGAPFWNLVLKLRFLALNPCFCATQNIHWDFSASENSWDSILFIPLDCELLKLSIRICPCPHYFWSCPELYKKLLNTLLQFYKTKTFVLFLDLYISIFVTRLSRALK